MRIDYTTRIEIDAPLPALTKAEQDRLHTAMTAALEDLIEAALYPKKPPPDGTVRAVRSSLGFLDMAVTYIMTTATAARGRELSALRQAIIDHTQGDDMFWIGEILLTELEKKTGFAARTPASEPPGAPETIAFETGDGYVAIVPTDPKVTK